jgi:trehalose-phosphatase
MASKPEEQLARQALRAAGRPGAMKTLLLDVDGTLAPIAPTPGEAAVPAATLEALRALVRGGWTVALVSGRPSLEVSSMVPIRGVKVFGSHGLQGSWSRGGSAALSPALRRKLDGLAHEAERLAAKFPGVLVERKLAGVALHDRKLTPRRRGEWHRRVQEWLKETDLEGLELLSGRRVLEMRPVGVHKGRVAQTMPGYRSGPPRDDTLIAIGDDRTDEDLFRAVGKSGMTIRVGRPGKQTRAAYRLASPLTVGRFLRALASTGS